MACGLSIKKHIIEHEILGIGSSTSLPLQVVNGILYVFDSSRDIWVTSNRDVFAAGKDGRAKNIYLRAIDGQASNQNGYRVSRDSVITTVVAQSRGTAVWKTHIRTNGNESDLYTLEISGGGSHDNNVDIRLNAGDRIQFYCESDSFFGIQAPLVWIEVAGRL